MPHIRPILAPLLLSLLASACRAFSAGRSPLAARRGKCAGAPALVRHPSHHRTTPLGDLVFGPRAAPLTLRWSSPAGSGAQTAPTESPLPSSPKSVDLHPPTLNAIAHALLVRAENAPGMPLRFVDDGSMEPWEIMMSAGKIAQSAAEEWAKENGINPMEDDELLQVMAGRVVSVVTRMEELEEELLKRCESQGEAGACVGLGVPEEELKARQSNGDDQDKRSSDAAAAVDAACLFDEKLRYNRARSLLAMFLHEIEGPGLRRNNVVIPCMDVDFLSKDEWGVLFFETKDKEDAGEISESTGDATNNSAQVETEEKTDDNAEEAARPSLHPITIDAIEEAFRLRAQNNTLSPLRLIDAQSEWFEVQYSIAKFADRFLEKYTKVTGTSSDDGAVRWTEEELQTIGGRIVGVLMRLDDLEWEWNHRVSGDDSLRTIPNEMWKTTLGLHPDNVEQSCVRTLDEALSEESDFARARAERMLALFLLNLEAPGLEASGNEVPGGSHPEFIEDALQLALMMPRPKKQ